MKGTFVLAQTVSDGEPSINLEKAKKIVEDAVKLHHADVLVFPELYSSLYPLATPHDITLAAAQKIDGPFVKGMCDLAKKHHLWMVFGFNEKVEDPSEHRNYNTTLVVNAEGEILSAYRKTHLYDAFGYKESDTIKPGNKFFEPIETPFGKIGLFVCYEVRFPEVSRYQRMKGADVILMPTAWVAGKMKSQQFQTLIAARAIENGVYVLACDQCGPDFLGESVAVDPMGLPIASAGERETLIVAHVDTDRVAEVRRKVASYDQRRPELYCI